MHRADNELILDVNLPSIRTLHLASHRHLLLFHCRWLVAESSDACGLTTSQSYTVLRSVREGRKKAKIRSPSRISATSKPIEHKYSDHKKRMFTRGAVIIVLSLLMLPLLLIVG